VHSREQKHIHPPQRLEPRGCQTAKALLRRATCCSQPQLRSSGACQRPRLLSARAAVAGRTGPREPLGSHSLAGGWCSHEAGRTSEGFCGRGELLICSRAKCMPSAAPAEHGALHAVCSLEYGRRKCRFSATQDACGYSSAGHLITIIPHLLPTHHLDLLASLAEN